MANRKITELTALTGANATDTDVFAIVDVSADETKKMTLGELKEAFDSGSGFVRITGDTMTGDLALSGADVTFGDDDKVVFGDASEFQIYHTAGGVSYITETGVGGLFLQGANVILENTSGDNYFLGVDGGASTLYYSGAAKLATTSTGVDITGTVVADVANISGSVTVGNDLTITDNLQFVDSGSTTRTIMDLSGSDDIRISTGTSSGARSIYMMTEGQNALRVHAGGDISFYEDTGTTPKMVWSASAESLTIPEWVIHDGNINTKFGFGSANTMNFISNGSDRLTIANSYTVFNEAGTDYDFRVESNDNTHMLFVDGGANKVGIGTSSPQKPLHIHTDTVNGPSFIQATEGDGGDPDTGVIFGYEGDGNYFTIKGINEGAVTDDHFTVARDTGNVGIGTSSPTQLLTVGDTGTTYTRLQFYASTSGASTIHFGDGTSGADNYRGYLNYAHDSNSMQFATGGSEAMRIDSSGILLVGQSSSTAPASGNVIGAAISPLGYISTNRTSVSAEFGTQGNGKIVVFRESGSEVGSIGTASSRSFIGSGSVGLFFDNLSNTAIRPFSTSALGTIDNHIDLGTSGNRFKDLYLSGGVFLGGTGSANKLDDYEEGTFTPVVVGGSSAGTASYSTQSGSYTKVGNLVTVWIRLNYTSGNGSGSLQVRGFPFTVVTTNIPAMTVYTVSIAASSTALPAGFCNLSDGIQLVEYQTGGNSGPTLAYDGSGEIIITGTYPTND